MNRRDVIKLVAGSVGLLALGSASKVMAGQTLVDKFQITHRTMKSAKVIFSSPNGFGGTITAIRGGRYRVEFTDRLIVSDGKTVWSATHSAKTVVINSYNASKADVSLERVLFDILSVYHAVILKESSSGGIIRLTPPSEQTVISGVTRIDAEVNTKGYVKSLTITEHGSTSTYTFSRFVPNAPAPASLFHWSVPKGWTVVDLRS